MYAPCPHGVETACPDCEEDVEDLRASPSGLYLAPIALFRAFHPPLFIPWSEIVALPSPRLGQPPWLTLRSVPGVRIRFAKRAFTHLERYM